MQWAYKIPVTAPCLKSFKWKIRVKSVWRSCNLNLASGYLRLDPCSECKISPLSLPLVCVRSDMAEQRLCQGHVAGGSEPSPTGWGVCGSGHTGQRTPAVAPTGRYIRFCVSVCVQWGLSVRDSCCVPEWRWGREKKTAVCVCVTVPSPLLSLRCLPISRCAEASVRVHRGCRVHGHLPCRLVRGQRLPSDPSNQICLYVDTQIYTNVNLSCSDSLTQSLIDSFCRPEAEEDSSGPARETVRSTTLNKLKVKLTLDFVSKTGAVSVFYILLMGDSSVCMEVSKKMTLFLSWCITLYDYFQIEIPHGVTFLCFSPD